MVEFDAGQFLGAIMMVSVFGITCLCYTAWFFDYCCCRRKDWATVTPSIQFE